MRLISLLIILAIQYSNCLIDIRDQGAVPHVDSLAAQFRNADIIKSSIVKANASSHDRTVRVPKGTFYTMPIVIKDIHNITILVEGKISASKYILKWPKKPNSPSYQDMIYISDSSHIELSGGGKIDGRGYHWWMVEWMRLKKLRPLNSSRPHMFNIERCNNFKIHDLTFKNSPMFHMRIVGSFYFDIYNLDIKVNATAQFNLAKRFSAEGVVPLFPLNTDGIDPAGQYFHIWNLTVQNYDDVVVPKPSHGGTVCNQYYDQVGCGTVDWQCASQFSAQLNAYFEKPFKAIYIKTNPGNSGSGQVKHIRYSNMYINEPIWWAIYLGPQQQKQPLGGGPGCMFYPFDPRGTCQTQPRIDIRNVTLENITVHRSLLFPIVLRCNETNPCTDINLIDVKVDSWIIGKKNKGYVCENVKGKQLGGHPKVDCLNQQTNLKDEKYYEQMLEDEMESLRKQLKDFSVRQIWQLVEKQINSVPYVEEDDEMDDIEVEDMLKLLDNLEEEY